MNRVEVKAQDYAVRNPYGGSMFGYLYGYVDCRVDVASLISNHPDIPEEKKQGIVQAILTLNQSENATQG